VQHDGDGWRCLVADALSQIPWRNFLGSFLGSFLGHFLGRFLGRDSQALFFPTGLPPQISSGRPNRDLRFAASPSVAFVPPLDAWPAWADCRNAPGTPSLSSRALLAQTFSSLTMTSFFSITK
jgi:hypothetical protein